jgi:hypothetical protein
MFKFVKKYLTLRIFNVNGHLLKFDNIEFINGILYYDVFIKLPVLGQSYSEYSLINMVDGVVVDMSNYFDYSISHHPKIYIDNIFSFKELKSLYLNESDITTLINELNSKFSTPSVLSGILANSYYVNAIVEYYNDKDKNFITYDRYRPTLNISMRIVELYKTYFKKNVEEQNNKLEINLKYKDLLAGFLTKKMRSQNIIDINIESIVDSFVGYSDNDVKYHITHIYDTEVNPRILDSYSINDISAFFI